MQRILHNGVLNGDAQGCNCVESCSDDLVHFKIKVSHFDTFFNLCFHFISVQWIDVDENIVVLGRQIKCMLIVIFVCVSVCLRSHP